MMRDGDKLKIRLLESGMTKSELGRRIETSSQNIYTLFKSKEINRELRQKLEKALDFKFEPEPVNQYQVEYHKILKKYIAILEENLELKENCK